MKKALVTLATLATVSASPAHNHANHIGAHEHGVAHINLVVEGNDVKVMLESPAMNIWGFEYEPKTEEELNKSHDALHYLKDGEWVVINGGQCKHHQGNIDWQYKAIIHEHFHDKDGKHKEHEHAAHKHDEHHHAHATDKPSDTGEHHHKHSDVSTQVDFHCQAPNTISSVAIELFEQYAGFEKIHVQWIAGDKQGATTLTKDSHEIRFK